LLGGSAVKQAARQKAAREQGLAGRLARSVAQPGCLVFRRLNDGGCDVLCGIPRFHRGPKGRAILRQHLTIGRNRKITLWRACLDRGFGGPRLDHRDADAKAAHRMVKRFRIAVDGVLAGGVLCAEGPGGLAQPRADVPEAPDPLRPPDRPDRVPHPHPARTRVPPNNPPYPPPVTATTNKHTDNTPAPHARTDGNHSA